MGTPTYKGANQPAADSGTGWLAQVGTVFGGKRTPAYASPKATDTAATPTTTTTTDDPDGPAIIVMPCPIDPDELAQLDAETLAASRFALIVPRRARCDE